MQKIYLVGYEGKNILNSATSGWWWFKGKQDADEQFEEVKTDLEPQGAFVYKGEIEVSVNLTDEEIDDFVDKFLSQTY